MAGISKKSPSFYRSSDPAENFKLKLQVRGRGGMQKGGEVQGGGAEGAYRGREG